MHKFYVPHKLSVGDTTNLSDIDANRISQLYKLHEEDLVEIDTPKESFVAQIVYLTNNSAEVELLRSNGIKEAKYSGITVIQAISNDSKFNFFLEKAVELRVERIIPLHSELCLIDAKQASKKIGLWEKVIKDATEQSRNPAPPTLEDITTLEKLKLPEASNRFCLATENIQTQTLNNYIKQTEQEKPFIVAVGPERGWSAKDIESLQSLKFHFVSMGDIILRTETAGIVVCSIINYHRNIY